MKIKYFLSICILVIVITTDQLTKNWIFENISYGTFVHIYDFFNIVHTKNTGGAFGFLSDQKDWRKIFFIVVPIIVTFVLIFWIIKLDSKHYKNIIALNLILAGAIGNIIDRIHYGFVIDFLDFHIYSYHWPAFNFADSAIVLGIIFILFTKEKNL